MQSCTSTTRLRLDEAKRVFEALAWEGKVTMLLAETFWSPKFGMCVD